MLGLKKKKKKKQPCLAGEGLCNGQQLTGKTIVPFVCYCSKIRTSPLQSVICFHGSRLPTGNGSHFKH